MADARMLEFNKLPRSARERFVKSLVQLEKPQPILADKRSFGAGIFGWAFLALITGGGAAGIAMDGFGSIWSSSAVHSPEFLLLYAIGLFVVAFSVLSIYRLVKLKKALPFPPGRYLFPIDFVDARERDLRVIPMASLEDFNGVHHHTNGAYTHTELRFRFAGGVTETFTVRAKHLAEEALRELGARQEQLRKAVQEQDFLGIAALDLFIEPRTGGPWQLDLPDREGPLAAEMPPLTSKRLVASLAVAAVLSAPLWLLRNRASDQAMFEEAQSYDQRSYWEMYLNHGGSRHADEVRNTLLPRAAFNEALKAESVTALRDFLKDFPGSVHDKPAKDAIHGLFTKALDEFKARASSEDPAMLPFVEQLLAYQEANGSPALKVHFRRPDSEALGKVDELLAKLEEDVAPVTKHFDDEHALPREKAIVAAMQDSFKEIFPADVLSLEEGARLAAEEEVPANAKYATVRIDYAVGWSGHIYTSEKGGRKFVGISVPFDVEMRVPGLEKPLAFEFSVQPPERFRVEFSSFASAYLADSLAAATMGAPDERVYEVMALRAFDQLGTKLRGVFFKAEPQEEAAGVDTEYEEGEEE